MPAGSDKNSPGNMNNPISVPICVKSMPNCATSGSAVDARVWNCNPRLLRQANSNASMRQRKAPWSGAAGTCIGAMMLENPTRQRCFVRPSWRCPCPVSRIWHQWRPGRSSPAKIVRRDSLRDHRAVTAWLKHDVGFEAPHACTRLAAPFRQRHFNPSRASFRTAVDACGRAS